MGEGLSRPLLSPGKGRMGEAQPQSQDVWMAPEGGLPPGMSGQEGQEVMHSAPVGSLQVVCSKPQFA